MAEQDNSGTPRLFCVGTKHKTWLWIEQRQRSLQNDKHPDTKMNRGKK